VREPERAPSRVVSLLLALGAVLAFVRSLLPGRARLAGAHGPFFGSGYEISDLQPGVVAGLGLALMLVIGLVVVAATVLQLRLAGAPVAIGPSLEASEPAARSLPAEPRLEGTSGETLAVIRTIEHDRLHSYGWVSRENGTARIPIELAMDLIAQRGLPSGQATPAPLTVPSDASSGRVEQRVTP
jgi:hypothetical protein